MTDVLTVQHDNKYSRKERNLFDFLIQKIHEVNKLKRLFYIFAVSFLVLSICSCSCSPTENTDTSSAPVSSDSSEASEPVSAEEAEPLPDNSWDFDTPEHHGMDAQMLARLHEALDESSVYGMVTAKDGVIIDEYYGEGYDENSTFPLYSCTKSFTSALIGIAIDQGKINSPDDLLSSYLPEVSASENPSLQQLTLRHLLTHTSGLEWYEIGSSYTNWEEFQSSPNWVTYILNRSQVSQPGTEFNYSTGNTHLLAAALENAVGMSELSYGEEYLFEPLGMESVSWGTDPQGITDGGNGISMTLRDAAKFGQLYLNQGVWQGKQLISRSWINDSTSPQIPNANQRLGGYGFQWWVNSFGENNYNTYYAYGAWGQFIFVVPELNLVTAVASYYPHDSLAPIPYFSDYILNAYIFN